MWSGTPSSTSSSAASSRRRGDAAHADVESLQVSLTEGGPAERQRQYEKCIETLEQETSVMRSKLKEGWRKVNEQRVLPAQVAGRHPPPLPTVPPLHLTAPSPRGGSTGTRGGTSRSRRTRGARSRSSPPRSWPTLNRLVQPLIDKRKFRELALSHEMRART